MAAETALSPSTQAVHAAALDDALAAVAAVFEQTHHSPDETIAALEAPIRALREAVREVRHG